jgi:hypothetical protein
MTIAYYSQREQVSRGNADNAASAPARMAHLALARAYGALVVTLKNTASTRRRQSDSEQAQIAGWGDEGGSGR